MYSENAKTSSKISSQMVVEPNLSRRMEQKRLAALARTEQKKQELEFEAPKLEHSRTLKPFSKKTNVPEKLSHSMMEVREVTEESPEKETKIPLNKTFFDESSIQEMMSADNTPNENLRSNSTDAIMKKANLKGKLNIKQNEVVDALKRKKSASSLAKYSNKQKVLR